jgi:hypothetical protein
MMKYLTASRKGAPPSGNAKGPSSRAIVPVVARGKRTTAPKPFVPPDLSVLENLPVQIGGDEPEAEVAAAKGKSSGKRKKRTRPHDGNTTWTPMNMAEFPWGEPVFEEGEGEDKGKVFNVKCVVCSGALGRTRLIKNKRDNLVKHIGQRKAKTRQTTATGAMLEVGQFYTSPDNLHWINDKIWRASGGGAPKPPAPKRIVNSLERSRKQVQFVLVMDILKRGRPMSDYPLAQTLLQFLNYELPKKHWGENSGWEIASSLKWAIEEQIREDIKRANFISISCDEVTSTANESWISIHVYLCETWARKPLLLCCKQISVDCNAENVAQIVIEALMVEGGMTKAEIGQKLISFGADGASVFQGQKAGVTKRMVETISPYVIGHHCMAHRTNLAAATLGNLHIVGKLEALCAALYSYFARSPKRYLAFVRLAEKLDTSGNKILQNVKPRWISMLGPMVRILEEYKTLVANMDECDTELGKKNLALLCDFESLLSLPAMIPLLDCVNDLIKFAQSRSVFICDFVTAVKVCQGELFQKFVDEGTAFQGNCFQNFCNIIADSSEIIDFGWFPDLETHEDFLSMHVLDAKHMCYKVVEGRTVPVNRELFDTTVEEVKQASKQAAMQLISELEERFPASDLVNAIGVVFPQYWMGPNCLELFPLHLDILKNYYFSARDIETDRESGGRTIVDALLNGRDLDNQATLFKQTMIKHAPKVMEDALKLGKNPLSLLWSRLQGSGGYLCGYLTEWFKMADLAVTTVIGSVEDERTFSTLSWLKSKVRNRLNDHLDCTISVYSQKYFELSTFPYEKAIEHWLEHKDRRGAQN